MSQQQEDCAICYDAKANCLIVPCGHQCGCEACLEKLQSSRNSNEKRCPICRARILSIVKVIPSGVGKEGNNQKSSKKLPPRLETLGQPDEPPSPLATSVGVASPFDLPAITLKVLPVDLPEEVDQKEVETIETEAVVRISVGEPETGSLSRLPVDVIACIDISGSMRKDATYEIDGETRTDGLSVLDVAKHGVKVILASLRKDDRFGLVAFDDVAELKFPLTPVTKKGRRAAVKAIDDLKHRGMTNIWAGVSMSLDSLRKAKVDSRHPIRNQAVLVLTDGRPTATPTGGHVHAYRQYCEKNQGGKSPQISCFGFGYNVDSKLMLEMADVGGGTFAFIPMAPVLGTVFTHALASVLSTYTTSSKLILSAPSPEVASFGLISSRIGVSFDDDAKGMLKGGLEMKVVGKDRGKLEVDVGPLLYGQTRDIVVPIRFPSKSLAKDDDVFLEAKLEYGSPKKVMFAKAKMDNECIGYDTNAEVAKIRCAVSDICREVVALGEKKQLDDAKKKLKELEKRMSESDDAYDERVVGLKKDVVGRVTKALDGKKRFNRWGKHYIRALLRAHAVQQCTNKLDFGVQVYGGSLFALMRQRGDAIFLTLPPPKPSNRPRVIIPKTTTTTNTTSFTSNFGRTPTKKKTYRAPSPPREVSMDTYTPSGGGCFGAESTVRVICEGLASDVRVEEVKKGDLVEVAGNKTAEVMCVVEAVRKDPKSLVAIPGGPLLTSKHPVRINGVWRMPEGLGPRVEAGGDGIVYNFVLKPRNAILLVSGYECVTLGHGLIGKGVEHEFYGSQRALDEVKKLSGWKNGRVEIGKIVRDKDGHAKGFRDLVQIKIM